jgi:hypothetical protein
VLLQNSATGDRAIWVVSAGSIVNAVSLGNVPTDWHIAGAGDFNADTFEDIVWENLSTGSRAIWLMNGAAQVLAAVDLGVVPAEWRIGGAMDLDDDGRDDLIWQRSTDGARAAWLMNGGSVLQSFALGTLDPAWRMVAANDLTNDGLDDIVLENGTTGSRVIWAMSGGSPSFAVGLGVIGTEWSLGGSGDIDADGEDDLLWNNTSTGARAAWLLNGAAVVLSAPTLTVESTLWSMMAVLIPTTASPVSSVTVTPESETLKQNLFGPTFGWTRQLVWDVVAADGVDESVTFTAENPAVVSVSGTGLVQALTPGTTNVIVASVVDPTKFDTYAVTVVSPCTQNVLVEFGYVMPATQLCTPPDRFTYVATEPTWVALEATFTTTFQPCTPFFIPFAYVEGMLETSRAFLRSCLAPQVAYAFVGAGTKRMGFSKGASSNAHTFIFANITTVGALPVCSTFASDYGVTFSVELTAGCVQHRALLATRVGQLDVSASSATIAVTVDLIVNGVVVQTATSAGPGQPAAVSRANVLSDVCDVVVKPAVGGDTGTVTVVISS